MKKSKPITHADEVKRLREDLNLLLKAASSTSLTRPALNKLNMEVRVAIAELDVFLRDLDPIRQPSSVFDPGNPKTVGRFISLAMVAQERAPLAAVPKVYGSGIYAIYYSGDFPLYAAISKTETPIYVGQAAPEISNARTATDQGSKLSDRLNEHRRNISKAANLSIDDFQYRSLVVQSGWETSAEDYLISLFAPLWNKETGILYGIGKHGDKATTRVNSNSPWDTVHQARKWATNPDAKSVEQISDEVARHLSRHPIYVDLPSVLQSFVDELRQ